MRKHRQLAALTNYKANDMVTDRNGDLGHELWSLSVIETYLVVFERTYSPEIFTPV